MASMSLWLGPDSLLEMTASADWQPVPSWETGEDGKRRPSTRQQMTADGVPVWEIRTIAKIDLYGRPTEEFLTLRTASASKPNRDTVTMLGVAS